ncbi:site-specific DNA-methyltransferase [Akkermansiaceae bacterium]|nr:site-specific DNA-methyltransferase [Akkermansiaceae bacterium]
MADSDNGRILGDPGELHGELRSFVGFGRATETEERHFGELRVPVYGNEFWTSKQRDGHSLHEVSYRACYKPQLPGFFIGRFCNPGDLVYDPFMGRGTTLVEAQLRGCRVVGNDVNPLSGVLAAPRLKPPTAAMVEARLAEIRLPDPGEMDPDLLVFFSSETLGELYGWRSYFRIRKQEGTFDQADAWIQMVACNRLTGHSKGFFSVYTLPPNQATSLAAQRRINEKRRQVPEYRDTKALILRKTKRLLRHPLPENYGRDGFGIVCSSADSTPAIPGDSVKLVVTSPPFLDAVDYVGDNWLRMWFCELEADPGRIWQIRSLEAWAARMTDVFRELKRVLQPGGVVAFEVGEVRGGLLSLENEVVKAGCEAGLVPECIMINSQDFTKTANCWGVSNNRKGTNSNRIVILGKEA